MDDPDQKLLKDHFEGTEKALEKYFSRSQIEPMMQEIREVFSELNRQKPDIGGQENIFSEWLTFGVYYLALYQVLKRKDWIVEEVGLLIYEAFEAMADYPEWLLNLVSRLKYGKGYQKELQAAAEQTQLRRFEGDWVAEYVEGDGEEFDYGLDITECGICKFYRQQGAEELSPYLCLSDYVLSDSLGRGLVRYQTLAEGDPVCDFRFKRGRATHVEPLRDGWPPQFEAG